MLRSFRKRTETIRRYLSVSTFLVALFILLFYLSGRGERIDMLTLDVLFQLRGARPAPSDIVIVALDEDFIQLYGQRVAEIDRRFYARVLNELMSAGARVIGMDFIFSERSRAAEGSDPDAELAEAVLRYPVVLPQVRIVSSFPGISQDFIPIHPYLQEAHKGVLTLAESARSFAPSYTLDAVTMPSFPLAMLELADLEAQAFQPSQLIDYRGPRGSFRTLSFLDVYRGQFSYSEVQDKLVLIGVTLAGTDRDQILTPFGVMSGVEVNANELYTLLYSQLRPLPKAIYGSLLIVLALVSPLIAKRRRGLFWVIALSMGLMLLAPLLFASGWFFSPLWLALVPIVAYLSRSYQLARQIDQQLTANLLHLVVMLSGGPSDRSAGQGFQGAADQSITEMLESLCRHLKARSALVQLSGQRYAWGDAPQELAGVLQDAIKQKDQIASANTLAEPLYLNDQLMGALALAFDAPVGNSSLIQTSLRAFEQLLRYQQLRQETSSFKTELLPWKKQSSSLKLQAVSTITDLISSERAWLETLLEALPQAVSILSPYGSPIYQNRVARGLLAENVLEAIPRVLSIEAEQFQQDYLQLLVEGKLELALRERRSGRVVLLSMQAVYRDEQIEAITCVLSDLSKLEEIDQRRQEMLALVLHDLRSPLTSIQGFAELLRQESQHEHLEIIYREANRMRQLTDGFLDLARLESGQLNLDLEDVNLADIIRQAVASMTVIAAGKQIVIELRAPTHLSARLDPELIYRLIQNLLSNAVKYSPAKTRIIVFLRQQTEATEIIVQDQGYGLSAEQQALIFDKYQRAGADKTTPGVGLGLYLVKRIVELHGGRISVDSQPGRGSSFSVFLNS